MPSWALICDVFRNANGTYPVSVECNRFSLMPIGLLCKIVENVETQHSSTCHIVGDVAAASPLGGFAHLLGSLGKQVSQSYVYKHIFLE